MLDFARLKTPADHGDVLVLPDPPNMVRAMRENHRTLADAQIPLLDETLASCRKRTRELCAGQDDCLVVVTGHQPGAIHPGVWAKHIVAHRLAKSVNGKAINLVVDCDAPKTLDLSVPTIENDLIHLKALPLASVTAGFPFEHIAPLSVEETHVLARGIEALMGPHFSSSQMPIFLKGFRQADHPRDWVDQMVGGRRAVEARFNITVEDRRVSEVWCSPLLLDILANAERFATAYNQALAQYRKDNGIRGRHHPIPDLQMDADRCEVPIWAYQDHQPRCRLFVSRSKDSITLYAGEEKIGSLEATTLKRCGALTSVLEAVSTWRLRPRALTLTLWARLLLADIFIHGIGGAKYDRITDNLIHAYYGISPPAMGCVSATLHLDLPTDSRSSDSLSNQQQTMRDLMCNPQRHLPQEGEVINLSRKRQALVEENTKLQAHSPQNRPARRRVFEDIHQINQALLGLHPETLEQAHRSIHQTQRRLQQESLSRGRDYFFALFDSTRLQFLLDALPDEGTFRL